MRFNLPENPEPYADKYFLRTGQILREEGINPWVKAQVMIRKGPGKLAGINEALAVLEKYSPLVKHGGLVCALPEGAQYSPRETLMLIEAPIQDIVELETMYLGVLSAAVTQVNDHYTINLDNVKENMSKVVKAAGRPVSYFGARHWHYSLDADIARAAFEGGATSASTDAGAKTFGQKGVGTTPHVLENIMAWKYGTENAVVETMKAFDRVIDPKVPRVALIDYRNREIDDTLAVAKELGNRFDAPRIDTCGENLAQGAAVDKKGLFYLAGKKVKVPERDEKYWFGNGVTVTGVYAVRKALLEKGYDILPFLSSGFANHKKVEAFVRAEKILGTQLFKGLGVGQVFESRAAKMDIVAVGEPGNMIPIAKAGRGFNPNPRLELVLGGRR